MQVPKYRLTYRLNRLEEILGLYRKSTGMSLCIRKSIKSQVFYINTPNPKRNKRTM